MKEEIRRIMALVQEGKLSPEDAAELIDAFAHAEEESEEASTGPQTPPPPPPDAPGADGKDPFKSFVEFMEGLGKEVNEVNWQEIAGHIRKGTQKGIDTLKQTAEQIKQGKVGFGWFGTSETREVKLPLTLGAGKTLRVENRAGDVKVTGGFPEGSVFAKVQVRGSDPEDARKRADEFNLILEESDHLILVRPPEGVGLSVDIVVQLDGAGHVEVVSESGDVRVLDTQAGAKVRTHSGDIQVRGLQGPAELLTQTGDIAVEECTSPAMTVENKAGDISVRKVQGNLSVRAASGDVAIRDCSGKTLSVESVTGDVLAKQLGYWKTQLAGLSPALEMPTDRPRPRVLGHIAVQRQRRSIGRRHPAVRDANPVIGSGSQRHSDRHPKHHSCTTPALRAATTASTCERAPSLS